MKKYIFKFYKMFLILLSMPMVLADYFATETGSEYNVRFFTKFFLVFRMINNNRRIITASNFLEHLSMATKIFNISKSVEGCVVECGCYKGGSTANLSLVCGLCSRKLEVFDSFEGLPEPEACDKEHIIVDLLEVHTYSKGAWSGNLEEVKGNVARHGDIKVCNFNVGYFDKTLPSFNKKCAFIFLDVDLRGSLEPCIRYLWPLLQDGCYLFTHESMHMEIASLFFDQKWWRDNLNTVPSGLIGAGSGIGLVPDKGAFKSAIGYTVKNPSVLKLKEAPQIGAGLSDA